MHNRFSDSRDAMSTLRVVIHFFDEKERYWLFAGDPLKKILGNFIKDFWEAIWTRDFRVKNREEFVECSRRGLMSEEMKKPGFYKPKNRVSNWWAWGTEITFDFLVSRDVWNGVS